MIENQLDNMSTRIRKKSSPKAIAARTNQRRAGSRARVHASVTPRRILVPIDFSPESTSALKYACAVAGKRATDVTLLHVVEAIYYIHDFGYGPVRRRRTNDPAVKRAEVRLRALGRRHLACGLPWAAVVRSGTICEEIAKAALEMNIEMIVMPTRGLLPAEHNRPDSVAARVVRQSPCPVLTLRKPLLSRSRTQN